MTGRAKDRRGQRTGRRGKPNFAVSGTALCLVAVDHDYGEPVQYREPAMLAHVAPRQKSVLIAIRDENDGIASVAVTSILSRVKG